MEVLHPRAAGMDVSKRDAKVAVRVVDEGTGRASTSVTTWGATVGAVEALVEHLRAAAVTVVVMEATGDYWKPFYFLMEAMDLPVLLVNAKQAKNYPGRKTDVSDAAWLADLAAHGLVRASFVPPEPIRELRDLTRARTHAGRDRARTIQRLEKFLESTGLKLSSVVSELNGVSSRAMLDALLAGERDPEVLADLARGKLIRRRADLVEALRMWRFTDHDEFMIGEYLQQIDLDADRITRFDARIEEAMAPFRHLTEVLTTIPGVSTTIAEVVIAETGGDMTVFPTAAQLASWAGVCPGSNESAGRVKSGKTRPGNPYLAGALGTAAMAATKKNSRSPFLQNRYRRVMSRRGKLRAIVAVEHTLLVAIWHMLAAGEAWHEPELEHHTTHATANRMIRQLHSLGYDVTITPTTTEAAA